MPLPLPARYSAFPVTREAVHAAYREGPDAVYELMVSLITPLVDHISRLEAQISKDSHNSSKPPSSDLARDLRRPSKSLRGKSGKRPGGQKGHPGRTLEMREVPDVIIPHAVTRCTSCGSPFTDFTDFTDFTAFTAFTESTPGKPLGELLGEVLDRRQVFDIVPAHLVVTEHQLIARKCEACGAYSVGDFPEDVRASVQYGSEVLALSVYLTAGQFLPLKRASELLGVIAGEPISQAALLSAEERAAEGLEETEREIFRLIQRSGVVHMDETGCFVEKKLHYLHDLSTTFLSHYTIHRKRGRKAFQDVGFLPSFHGVAVHDGCESYTASAYPCDHALCGAHLLRDLTFVEEEEKKEWAGKLKRLLRAMKRAKERAIEQGRTVLERRSLARYERRYTRLLEEADRAEPPPEPRSGKSGPRRRTAGRNLLERLERQRAMVTRFLHDFRVPFDNSESERDLRMMKLKQKISGGFRTMEGARRFARIRGYLNTARKQGHSPLEVLRDFFRGHPYQPAIAPPE